MSLDPETRLGSFEIVERVGAISLLLDGQQAG
jgi:hypothetical protein